MLSNASEKYDRIDQESGRKEKSGDKKRIPKNSNFSLAGFSWAAALTANPARNAPTMPGRLMLCANTAATPMIPSITTKYAFSSASSFFSKYAPRRLRPIRMSGTKMAIRCSQVVSCCDKRRQAARLSS